MRKRTISLMMVLIMMSAASVKAQVIIGGDGTDNPHAGAGLDLSLLGKQNFGLLLPNMELTDNAAEFALVVEATPKQKTDARGMIVYNIKTDVLDGAGLYVWNGAKWQAVALTPPTVTDTEGNTYPIGFFGDAGWWMTENLRSTSGLEANSNPGGDISLKYYCYPNNSQTTFNSHPEYGLLYTWAAASGCTEVDNTEEGGSAHTNYQGICPSDWHLPSHSEWSQLIDVISNSAAGEYSTTTETGIGNTGTKMKSKTAVNDQATNGTSKLRTANGFDALLVGFMYRGSPYNYGTDTYGTYTAFWSSNSYYDSYARIMDLDKTTGAFQGYYNKYYMLSVRCKKD
jgi:uncharacterized protein (TIGR02145 family)